MSNDRAQAYVDAIDGAGEGERNATLNGAAYRLMERFDLGQEQLFDLVERLNARCTPPLTEVEVERVCKSAYEGAKRNGAAGSKAQPETPKMRPHFKHSKRTAPSTEAPPLDPAVAYLEAAFAESELVNITPGRMIGGEERPQGKGTTLPREMWIEKIREAGGIGKVLNPGDGAGLYVCVNPLTDQDKGRKNANVAAYRHVLVEFDDLEIAEQEDLIRDSRLPVATLVSSGGKSIHALVRVDAPDAAAYRDAVEEVYSYFADRGHAVDGQNKNPARLSRLAGAMRHGNEQALLDSNIGMASLADWRDYRESAADEVEVLSVSDLLAINKDMVPVGLLGRDRWLCKGHSAILVGPTGVGKSAFVMHSMVQWGLGLPVMGIRAARPLSSLLIQAENDRYDLLEALWGAIEGIDKNAVRSLNIHMVHNSTRVGEQFLAYAEKLIEQYHPDMIWCDPLLSYYGDDVNDQAQVAKFFRNGVQPLMDATGVIWWWVHHTGKPGVKADKADYSRNDDAYRGLGSSDLSNWPRAIVEIRPEKDDVFSLRLNKRGKRAGVPMTQYMRHSEEGIVWEPCEAPQDRATTVDEHDAIMEVITEGVNQEWGAKAIYTAMAEALDCSVQTAKRRWTKEGYKQQWEKLKGVAAAARKDAKYNE